MDSQCEMVLQFLHDNGSITQMEAVQLGIMRLGARVWDLRDAGYPIKAEMVSGKNRYGKRIRYARYSLES